VLLHHGRPLVLLIPVLSALSNTGSKRSCSLHPWTACSINRVSLSLHAVQRQQLREKPERHHDLDN
jgi:hypothetical protein